MHALFDRTSFSPPTLDVDAFRGPFVGRSTFDGCIVFSSWQREDVEALLPEALELPASTSATPDRHPVVFLFGDQREGPSAPASTSSCLGWRRRRRQCCQDGWRRESRRARFSGRGTWPSGRAREIGLAFRFPRSRRTQARLRNHHAAGKLAVVFPRRLLCLAPIPDAGSGRWPGCVPPGRATRQDFEGRPETAKGEAPASARLARLLPPSPGAQGRRGASEQPTCAPLRAGKDGRQVDLLRCSWSGRNQESGIRKKGTRNRRKSPRSKIQSSGFRIPLCCSCCYLLVFLYLRFNNSLGFLQIVPSPLGTVLSVPHIPVAGSPVTSTALF